MFNGAHPTTVVSGPTWVPSRAPLAGATPLAAALAAEDAISLPSPTIRLDPSRYSVVGLATWTWIDRAVWHGYSATASVAGVTATAEAVPETVRWSMGDGAMVVCFGPGVPYRPNVPASAQKTDCSHTYEQTSLDQPSPDGRPDHSAYTVTATITWVVTWTSSVPGEGGSLPALYTSSSIPVRVEQVQSVRESG